MSWVSLEGVEMAWSPTAPVEDRRVQGAMVPVVLGAALTSWERLYQEEKLGR